MGGVEGASGPDFKKVPPLIPRTTEAYLLTRPQGGRGQGRRGEALGRGWVQERSFVTEEEQRAVRERSGRGRPVAAAAGLGDDMLM